MKINILNPLGVHEAEKKAINILEHELPNNWLGYAALEMVGRDSEQFEADLILVTHDRIIVVELKNYFGNLYSNQGKWVIQIGERQESRPNGVNQSRRASKILAGRIKDRLQHKLKYTPWVSNCVVLCGKATNQFLPENEKQLVFHLNDFKTINKQKNYEKFFPKSGLNQVFVTGFLKDKKPNEHKVIWKAFFENNSNDFRPKVFSVNGYAIVGDKLFEQRDKVYAEYKSERNDDKNYKALLRRWDFSANSIASLARTTSERNLIAYRESKVLGYIDSQGEDFKDLHLRLLHFPTNQLTDFVELYDWPKNRDRLDDFLIKKNKQLTPEIRLDIIQVLLSQLSRLHKIKVAHRDIGAHSVWLSLPSKVMLSNFLTASYPDPDNLTVQSFREVVKHGRILIPEDLYEDENGTPYTRDVFLVACVCHYIAYDKWPQKEEDGTYIWKKNDNDQYKGILDKWFEKALEIDALLRFKNIEEALDSFNDATLSLVDQNIKNSNSIQRFYSDCNVYTDYDTQVIQQKGTMSHFQTIDKLYGIKLWHGVSEFNEEKYTNQQLLVFLSKANSMSQANIPTLPQIVDFGYNQNMQATFLIYSWAEGQNLSEFIQSNPTKNIRLMFAKKLIDSIVEIHRNEFSHGDLHPQNIIIKNMNGDIELCLIDCINYSEYQVKPYHPNYVPENHESLSSYEKDRFATIKIIRELSASLNFQELDEYLDDLLNRNKVSEIELPNLLSRFDELINPKEQENVKQYFVEIPGSDIESRYTMRSDQGAFSIRYRVQDRGGLIVKVYLVGPGEQLDIHIDYESKKPLKIHFNRIQHDQYIRAKRDSDIEIPAEIVLINSPNKSAVNLIDEILKFDQIINEVRKSEGKENLSNKEIIKPNKLNDFPPIREIWKSLIETEHESLPKIIITSEPIQKSNEEIIVHYSTDGQNMDFNLNLEKVFLKLEFSDHLRVIGSIKSMDQDTIIFEPNGKSYKSLQVGTSIWLEGMLTAASLSKRKKAVEQLIKNKAVIRDLPEFFDLNSDLQPIKLANIPSEEELNEYNTDSFSLNRNQREAFKNLYAYGPLGLLQGPPGTGKTTFISTFIHFIVSKGAANVLLVSQSHEAVNNAAEKVRNIFSNKNQEISIIRLGDEGNVSESLSDVNEVAIQDHYREKFRATLKVKIKETIKDLALPETLIDKSIEFELSFGKDLDQLIRISQKNLSREKNFNNLKSRFIQRSKEIMHNICEINHEDIEHKTLSLREIFYEKLQLEYGIDNPSKITKLINVLNIAKDWLSSMSSRRSQFQNFLTKTRTLVCGTCVGIGRTNYGIEENIYDWVIIDEAARATASELAIAMLVGRRVLLVGDHKQLPPQMELDHLKAARRKIGNIELDELAKSDFERSFLSNYGETSGQFLQQQFRMAKPICNLVSESFYDNKLKTSPARNSERVAHFSKETGTIVNWLDTTSARENSFDSPPRNRNTSSKSYVNSYECNVIIRLLNSLSIDIDVKNGDVVKQPIIGIICMYKEQRRLLYQKLNALSWARNLLDKRIVKVDTVDSYQGKENQVIIISLVRNNEHKNIGFLNLENRANVAISRAIDRLYIIGASRMWRDKRDISFGKILSNIEEKNSDEYKVINTEKWQVLK